MGWAMASYHRSIRLVQQNKSNISVVGTVLQFLWHFCITGICIQLTDEILTNIEVDI